MSPTPGGWEGATLPLPTFRLPLDRSLPPSARPFVRLEPTPGGSSRCIRHGVADGVQAASGVTVGTRALIPPRSPTRQLAVRIGRPTFPISLLWAGIRWPRGPAEGVASPLGHHGHIGALLPVFGTPNEVLNVSDELVSLDGPFVEVHSRCLIPIVRLLTIVVTAGQETSSFSCGSTVADDVVCEPLADVAV